MTSDYRSIENALLDILITIKDRLEILNISHDLYEKAENAISFVNSKRYQIAVVGAFKTGKSSLVNGLLGSPNLLPEDIIPATATINRIVFGKDKNATAFYYDGSQENIPFNELEKYVAKTTADGAHLASLIKEVVISMPTVICQNHIEVIDTPGLNDDEKMTAITLRAVDEVDAIILTMSQQFQFDDYISKFVYELIKKDTITNIVFVVTHIDELYETLEDEGTTFEEYIEFLKKQIRTKVFEKIQEDDPYTEKAHRLLDADKIQLFGVSSYLYFQYLKTKDPNLLEKSRFELFMDKLVPILTAQQIGNSILKAKYNITKIIDECNSLEIEKEKDFESQIGKIASAMDFLKHSDAVTNMLRKTFNEVFHNHYSEYDECIRTLNAEKNIIATELYNSLKSITNDLKNETKQEILTKKFIEIEEREEKNVFASLRDYIASINKKVFQEFSKKTRNVLVPIVDILGNAFDLSNLESFLYNAEFIKKNVSFQWEHCPVTKDTDCQNPNLMDLFVDAIDISMETSKAKVKNLYNNKIQQKSLDILRKIYSGKMSGLGMSLEEERRKLEEEKITFKNNFHEFSEKIPALKEKIESFSYDI